MIILALDPGQRRTGYCLSDPEAKIPSKSGVIAGELKTQLKMITELVADYGVKKIICGYPLGLSGQKTKQTEVIDEFIELLQQATGMDVEKVDERFSTEEAKRVMREMGKKQKHKEIIDEISARLLLDSYLRKFSSEK